MAGLTEKEFLELLERYKDEFYRYVCRMVWTSSAAEDVFASGIAVAWEKRESFRTGSNFRAWVYRILTNKCYVANRETKRHGPDIETIDESLFATDPDEDSALFENPEDLFEHLGDELLGAMNQLSTGEKSCLLLLVVEKFSYKEIAETLDMPIGTVMTHLSRGRHRLRRLLMDYVRSTGIVGKDNKHVKTIETERRRSGDEG